MTPIDDVSQPDTLSATHAPYTNLISHSLTLPDFRQLLDLADIYIFTKDILDCYTYVNKKMQVFLGASLTEIIGRNDSDFFDPALSHELQRCDRRVLELGEVISSEETTLNKISQEPQVFLILKSPLRNSLGNIIGLLGISTDISDRKNAERSLATQQTNLSLALANINEGLVISNIDGEIISFNDAFASLFALDGQEMPKTVNKLDEIFEVSTLEVNTITINKSMLPVTQTITKPRTAEFQLHRKDTEQKWIAHFNYSPIRNEHGKITGTATMVRDVTQERLADSALKAANAQLLSFIVHAPVSMAMFDRNMNYLAASEQWRLQFKLNHQDIRGCNHYELNPDLPIQWQAIHQQGLSGATLKAYDELWTQENGREYFLDWAVSPWHDDTGIIAGITVYTDDINNIRFFDQSMQDSLSDRAILENELRMASHHNQFQLYYQPQVDNQGKLTGTEALIRWHHPTRGLLLPIDFIPIAEEMGLIALIGEWAIEVACRQLLSWANSKASQHLHIAVNISTYQFLQKNFPQRVLDILSYTGAKASLLKLEITESLLIDNVEDVITKMSILKAQGVCFSLDDFGTGYSSLYYLKKLPLDQLKIDQSFVRDLVIDANDAAISQTILALAKSMNLNVIAEGVETQAQRDFLAQQGCLDFQGYLFGVAMPIEQFEALFFV